MALDTQEALLAGRYRKLRLLGIGGMARVHLAEDARLRRRVAIKQLHSDSPDEAARRFQREARLGASLNHPNLVYVFDIETDDESVLIVMEYVDGETLGAAMADGPLESGEAERVIRDVADALDHIHAQGVVHRDVKPGNILIGADGRAKLADLGIATAAEGTRITRSGTVLGTAAYMAPEQLDGAEAGPASDVYSLAAVAFEALAGRKARLGRTPVEIAHQTATEPAPDIRDAWPQASDKLAEALASGMARDPADRPASAGALADAIERGLAARGRPALLSRPPATRRVPPWLPPVAALAAVVALATGIATGSLTGGDDDGGATRDQAAQPRPEQRKPAKEPAQKNQPGAAEAPAQKPAAPAQPEESDSRGGGSDPASLNDTAFELMNEGRYDQAVPLLERAVAAYGDGSQDLTYAYALFNLGKSLRLAGRPDEAVPILERRLQIPNQKGVVKRELKLARKAARS